LTDSVDPLTIDPPGFALIPSSSPPSTIQP